MTNEQPQRSALYVPASNQRAIEKSTSIDADWIIFDLEDSVAPQSKAAAREALKIALAKIDYAHRQIAIRCNQVGSAEFPLDLELVAACRPQAVLLPKVSSVIEIENFALQADKLELDPLIACWFMIETARGLNQLEAIVACGVELRWRLSTLVVGHNDIASETGVSIDNNRMYLVPWLMQVVLQAKQANLQVLDSVWNNFRDLEGFEAQALQGKQMGFDGKTLIHPSQVESANRVFSPTEEEINRAQTIVDAFAKPANKELNVLNINGEMVERLHLDLANRLLQKFSSL